MFCCWGILVAIFAVFGAARTGVVATVRGPLDAADAEADAPGHSAIRDAEEEAVTEVPAVLEEAVVAEQALLRDQRAQGSAGQPVS